MQLRLLQHIFLHLLAIDSSVISNFFVDVAKISKNSNDIFVYPFPFLFFSFFFLKHKISIFIISFTLKRMEEKE